MERGAASTAAPRVFSTAAAPGYASAPPLSLRVDGDPNEATDPPGRASFDASSCLQDAAGDAAAHGAGAPPPPERARCGERRRLGLVDPPGGLPLHGDDGQAAHLRPLRL